MIDFHVPVLKKEVVSSLNIEPGKKYIDATVGGGGHAFEILSKGGVLLGIDQDQEAIDYTNRKWKIESRRLKIRKENLTLVRGNFVDINRIARERGFEHADGVIFDLGVSSYQIDKSGRGFSFLREEPLDMRMSSKIEITAKDIVNKASFDELYNIFSKFGEEKNAWAICDAIVLARQVKPIKTSRELAEIVAGVNEEHLRGVSRLHPATRVFQALRIVVNSEIDNLRKGLGGAFEILAPNGRLMVISFHSLEDRVVKLFFTKLVRAGAANFINKKPIIASDEEIKRNRRARSAKLRVIVRLG